MNNIYSLDKFKEHVESTVTFMRDFMPSSTYCGELSVSAHNIYFKDGGNVTCCYLGQFTGPSDDELRLWADSIDVPFTVR